MNVGKQKIALGCYTDASHPNGLKMLELDESSGAMSVIAERPVSNALYQALSPDGKFGKVVKHQHSGCGPNLPRQDKAHCHQEH